MKRILISLILVLSATSAFAASKINQIKEGNRWYQNNDYEKAVESFSGALQADPDSDILNFNLGTAQYKKQDYVGAIAHLNKALLGDDPKLKEKTQYNLGNAYYKSGIAQEDKKIEEAINSLTQSLSHYEEALKLDPKDAQAKHNQEFVQKELERLKKKKDQEQQKKQQQDQKSQDKQDQKEQNKQDQPKDQSSQQQKQDQSSGQRKDEKNQSEQEKNKKGQEQQSGQEKPESQQKDGSQKNKDYNQDKSQAEKDKEKSSGSAGESGSEGVSQDSSGREPVTPGEMSKEEAQRMLQAYQQQEEPQGLLNLRPGQADEQPVKKDW